MNKYEKIIFWLKFSLKLNDYSSCGLQQCYTTVSMKEIQSNAHQNFIVCKESMTYLNQILSECGLTCGLLCLLTTKDKCLKKVNKQGICGTAPDLTSHFYCCFFFKDVSIQKKKVPNGICYFMKIAPETFRHTSHLGSKADPLPAEGSHASLWFVQTRRRVLAFDVTSFSFWRTSKLDFTGDLNKQKQPQNFLKDPWRQLSSSWSAAP